METQQNQLFETDRMKFLGRLGSCPAGIFSKVVFCLDPPVGVLSGEKTSQVERADELIKWAEHPDGPGLQTLRTCYLRAIGKDPKTQEESPEKSSPTKGRRPGKDGKGKGKKAIVQPPEDSPSEADEPIRQLCNFIMDAQECVQKASDPFDGKGYIMSKKYEEAIDQLNTTKENLQKLHLLLDEILSFPREVISKYQKLIENYEDLVNRIYRIDAESDILISYIDAERDVLISYDVATRTRRQEIVEKASELRKQMKELDLLIQAKEIPS